MNNLPDGTLFSTSSSPKENYIVNAYLCSGNVTTDFSVRCEVVEKDETFIGSSTKKQWKSSGLMTKQ